jgi:hypothetical protein
MALINEIISPRSWVLVRDQIALIITTELANQAAITYEDYLDCDVYVERHAPITTEELVNTSVVNVSIESVAPSNQTIIDSDVTIQFNIAITTSVPSNDTTGGDVNSAIRNQHTASVIHGILSHPLYIRLGFAPPFIMRRTVSEIKFGTPSRQDSINTTMALISLEVVCSQNEPESTGIDIGSAGTTFKLQETEKGYKYELE